MPEDRTGVGQPSQPIEQAIEEVRGSFPSDAALQDAIAKLTTAGFDHAELSLPQTAPSAAEATPEAGADNPDTDEDVRQVRTLNTGLAGAAGMMAAGAALAATGVGLPAVAAAAAAAGAGSGLAVNAASRLSDDRQHEERERRARAGQLVLAVRAPDPEKRERAGRIMAEAGARKVEAVRREGVDSAAWTG
jgi:hypothetical protein